MCVGKYRSKERFAKHSNPSQNIAEDGQSVKKSSNQSNRAVKRLGVFTNMRFTREHQYGYSVELWQEKDRVFGLFLSSEGLSGDTPTGLLEDAAFDAKTGRLTFRARLSTGMTFGAADCSRIETENLRATR